MGAVMCAVEWWPYPTAVMRRCGRIANHAGDHYDSQYLGRQNTWTADSGGIHAPGPRGAPVLSDAHRDPAHEQAQLVQLRAVKDALATHPVIVGVVGPACGVFVAGTQQRCVLPEHHTGWHALPVETCPSVCGDKVCALYPGHAGTHGADGYWTDDQETGRFDGT